MSFVFAALWFLLYILPSIAAERRQHKNRKSILIINLAFGWTLIGWIICLAWAYSGNVSRETIQSEV